MPESRDASDEDLSGRIKNGDPHAFKELFDANYGSLFRFFIHRGMDPGRAEDMAQDIFVRVWLNRDRLKPGSSLRAYLFQAAANEIGMYLRKKKVRDDYASDVRQNTAPFSPPIQDFDRKQHIQKAIDALPEPLQDVFVLHRYDELTYKEIALLRRVSVKTVESRMSKALKLLRNHLHHLVHSIIATLIWVI